MSKILVSLVSEQTIPNLLFIKEIQDVEKYLFISTEVMENNHKTQNIIESAEIPNDKCHTILVEPNNMDDILKKLEEIEIKEGDKIYLNITGGTKIMALGVFDSFKKRNAEIFYIALGKNVYERIFPLPKIENNIEYRLNINEYLTAHGIEYKYKNKLLLDEEFTKEFYNFIFPVYLDQINSIREVRNRYGKNRLKKKGYINLSEIEFDKPLDKIIELVKMCNFDPNKFTKNQIEYIIGGWFEEYIFSLIKEKLSLFEENIHLNLEINKDGVANEIDVAFIYNNIFYIIECKTTLNMSKPKDKEKFISNNILNDTIYKQAALRKNFGLSIYNYLFTTENVENINHLERAELFNIEIIDGKTLKNQQELDKKFFYKIEKKGA